MTESGGRKSLLLGTLIGSGVGGVAGWFSRGVDVAPGPDPEVHASARAEADDPAPEHAQPPAPSRVSAPVAKEPQTSPEREAIDPMFSARLLLHAKEQIARGWHMKRSDDPSTEVFEEGEDIFMKQTLALPIGIGIKLADRRSAAELAEEDAQTGGVFAVLKRLDDGGPGPLFDVVNSAKTFNKFFQREGNGPYLAGETALKSREPAADGATVNFPAGVFELQDFGSHWRTHYPRDLTISGSGMGATMLVLRSNWSAYDTVRNLTIENCTIYANNNYLFDVRQPAMSVTIRRCRLTGWMTGAGASCLFGTRALALRVIDSEITGVYNRYPAYGQLFDVRTNGLLARFENCTIEACHAFAGTYSGATLVFVNCTMRNLFDRSKKAPKVAKLRGCQLTWFEGKDHNALKRDINDLFPDWKKQMRK